MSRLERVQSEQGRAASQQARMYQPHDGRVYIYDIMQPREEFPPTEPMPAHSFPCMAQGYVQPPLNAQLDGRPHKQKQKQNFRCVASHPHQTPLV